MAGGHLLTFHQHALARRHVIVENLARTGHGRGAEAQHVGVKLITGIETKPIGFLGKGDGVLFAAGQITYDDARQAVLALQPDMASAQATLAEDQATGAVRHKVQPVGRIGGPDGRPMKFQSARSRG